MRASKPQFAGLLAVACSCALLGCASTSEPFICAYAANTEEMAAQYLGAHQIAQAREIVELVNAYGTMTESRLGWWRALLAAFSIDEADAVDWRAVAACLWREERARGLDSVDQLPGGTQALMDLYGRCSPATIGAPGALIISVERRGPGAPILRSLSAR